MISIDYDFISFDKETDNMYPFFSWQCLSIQLSTRTVDLVIKDDNQMDILIAFLVQALKTVDGTKGTAIIKYEASI